MFYNMVFLSGNLAVADGKITAVVGTNISSDVDGRVYSYHYGYLVESVSYTGNSNGYGGGYNVNDSVVIEYALNSPSRSRLRDLPRIKPIDPVMVLVFVMFPLIGLGFIIPCIRKGLKGARLLRSGKQCIGERVKKESTFRENNNKVVYKYTFTFKANGGQSYLVSAKTHEAHLFAGEGAFYENTRQNNRNSF
ncbi:MAG: hypothetical protein GY757_30105, partial [bacterium]|nr:hypothetical protein [bacterium]